MPVSHGRSRRVGPQNQPHQKSDEKIGAGGAGEPVPPQQRRQGGEGHGPPEETAAEEPAVEIALPAAGPSLFILSHFLTRIKNS